MVVHKSLLLQFGFMSCFSLRTGEVRLVAGSDQSLGRSLSLNLSLIVFLLVKIINVNSRERDTSKDR